MVVVVPVGGGVVVVVPVGGGVVVVVPVGGGVVVVVGELHCVLLVFRSVTQRAPLVYSHVLLFVLKSVIHLPAF